MKLNIYLTPDQREIVTATERFLSLMAGRRWGKTATVRNRILYRAFQKAGLEYFYITPYYAQSVEEYDKFIEHDSVRRLIAKQRRQPFPQLRFINGSKLAFRSFEKPKSIRSAGPDEVWVDEIQDINEDQFWPIIRPLISDSRGTLGVSGQFRGYNWYYKQLYLPGLNPKSTIYKSWRKPSSTGLQYMCKAGREEIELAKIQIPKLVYDQEYDCIPSANQNAVFDPNDVMSIIKDYPTQSKPNPGVDYILAIDIGRVVDYCVFVIMEANTCKIVYAYQFELRTKHEIMARQIAVMARRFSASVICDTTGGGTGGHEDVDKYVEYYRKEMPRMRSFVLTERSKESVITELSLAIQNKTFSISRQLDALETQLREYEYYYRNGKYHYSAPKGRHDDFVTAIALALYAEKRKWFGKTNQTLGAIID